MSLSDLETLANRPRMACPKGESRLQEAKAEKKLTIVDERAFRTEVWSRDAGCCRKCGRKVRKDLARSPLRGEVHHIYGRQGDLRFETRAAILVCCSCHELLTGRVNERWKVIRVPGSTFWTLHGQELINAQKPIGFARVA